MGEKPPACLDHSVFKCIMHDRNLRLQTPPNPSGPSPLLNSPRVTTLLGQSLASLSSTSDTSLSLSLFGSELLNSVTKDTIKWSSLSTPHLPSWSFSISLHTWLLRDFEVLLSEILTHHTSIALGVQRSSFPARLQASVPNFQHPSLSGVFGFLPSPADLVVLHLCGLSFSESLQHQSTPPQRLCF